MAAGAEQVLTTHHTMNTLLTSSISFTDSKNKLRPVIYLMVIFLLIALTACNRDEPTPTPDPEAVLAVTVAQTPSGADAAVGEATNTASVGEAAATATPVPLPEAAGTITLWHSWAEGDGDALATILVAFKERYPEIEVETLYVAYNDLPQSYADAVRANAGPDVVLMPNWWIGDMVAAGVLQSLDAAPVAALLDRTVLNNYWPATLENLRWQGELYGLPTNIEVVSLFYNRGIIDSDLPQTMDELLALTQSDPRYGIGLYASLYHLYWGFPAYGAQLLDGEGQAILDQGDSAADYLRWLQALSAVDGTYVDSDYGMLLDRFKKREFAFLVDGPWSIGELRQALGDELGITQLPAGPSGEAAPWLSADGVFLNPKSDRQQQYLALLLAQHFGTTESGEALAYYANRVPANRNVVLESPWLQGFVAQAATAQSMLALPEMENVWGYGGDLLLKVLAGDQDPVAAVVETATLINEANGK